MIHTDQCLIEQSRARLARAEFEALWPSFCKSCDAGGVTSFEQGHPYGSTTAYETLFEPCDDCYALGQCPRCRGPIEVEDPTPCPTCGWRPDEPKDMAPPAWDGSWCGCAPDPWDGDPFIEKPTP